MAPVIRDPISDHLITPQNSAMVVIDYQPAQVGAVRSMDRDLLVKNNVSTVKIGRVFGLPIVHSTVNVKSGRGKPTVSPLAELQRDWARQETVADVVEIVLTERLLKE